jgi:hypothetical protein
MPATHGKTSEIYVVSGRAAAYSRVIGCAAPGGGSRTRILLTWNSPLSGAAMEHRVPHPVRVLFRQVPDVSQT